MTTAQEAIESLPGSVSEIYQVLEAAGVDGREAAPCDCPIANFIKLKTGETWWVEPGRTWETTLDIEGRLTVETGTAKHFDNPQAVHDFVMAFDLGREVILDGLRRRSETPA